MYKKDASLNIYRMQENNLGFITFLQNPPSTLQCIFLKKEKKNPLTNRETNTQMMVDYQ